MSEAARQRGERLQIMLDPEELAAVEDFRFKKRMPSRASAATDCNKPHSRKERAAGALRCASAGLFRASPPGPIQPVPARAEPFTP